MAETEGFSLQRAAELFACYLGLLCSFRLETSFPLSSGQSKSGNEWVFLELKIIIVCPVSEGCIYPVKKYFILPSCEKVAHPLNGCQTPWMWLQVAETWLLLKHCWKMISVINTSALSAVFVLVLLQLVWSVLEPYSGWLFGSCQCCSSALAAATLWQAGQMVACMGAAVVCSGLPSVFGPLTMFWGIYRLLWLVYLQCEFLQVAGK